MSAGLLDFASLTARRKADRAVMALRLADLADEYRFAAWCKPEQPGTRRTDVDLEFPRGLKLTVSFDASPGGTDPDTYVLSWHLSIPAIDEGTRLHPGMFGHVNPYGGHKATDVATGFAQLVRILRERFAVIRDDSAFVSEAPDTIIQPDPETGELREMTRKEVAEMIDAYARTFPAGSLDRGVYQGKVLDVLRGGPEWQWLKENSAPLRSLLAPVVTS